VSDSSGRTTLRELRDYLDWLERWSHDALMQCAECGAENDGRRGWTLRLDVYDELVTFCPDCDRREFGDG